MRIALGLLLAVSTVVAQNAKDTPEAHFAAARAAAGEDFQSLYNFQCEGPGPAGARGTAAPGRGQGRGPARGPQGPPDRSTWHAEPVKVFDNLYFFGQTEYSVWAITTSQGIIVLDTIFDYSVEDEVVDGMKKLGLDPATIKYAVVSHAHPDHDGGARFLQEHYGTRVIMSPADWDVLDKRTVAPNRNAISKPLTDRSSLSATRPSPCTSLQAIRRAQYRVCFRSKTTARRISQPSGAASA